MRCLLTGGTGYVGSALCRKLAGEGNDITCIVRPESDIKPLLNLKNVAFQCPSSEEDYIELMTSFKPDIIFHLAARGGTAKHNIKDIRGLIQSNVEFPSLILDAMSICGVKNFINVGSCSQNPSGDEYCPTCLYAATKQAFCDILEYYRCCCNFNAVTLKLHDTYGTDDKRPKILNLLQKAAITGEHLSMSPGEQLLDLVFIDDVTEAISEAGKLLLSGQVSHNTKEYTISSKSPIKLKNLVQLIEKEIPIKLDVGWGELPYRPNEVMERWEGGSWVPGWRPKISLKDGIKMLKWTKK